MPVDSSRSLSQKLSSTACAQNSPKLSSPRKRPIVSNFQSYLIWIRVAYLGSPELELNKFDKIAAETCKEISAISTAVDKNQEEAIKKRMEHIQLSLMSDLESFIDEFIAANGLSKLMGLLKHPVSSLVVQVMDCIPRLLMFDSTMSYIRSNPNVFVGPYEKMESTN